MAVLSVVPPPPVLLSRLFGGLLVAAGCLALGSCPLATLDDYYADLNNERGKDKVLVSDYNLQAYVPVPVEGVLPIKEVSNREDMVIRVVWKNTEAQALGGDFVSFVLGTVYSGPSPIWWTQR